MKLTLQKNIPALSGKSRQECAEIIYPLAATDSKLKFYRKIFVGIFIMTPASVIVFYDGLGRLSATAGMITCALVVVIISTFLQLFCFNPRLKEILGDKSA
jgi:hypothetical protein